MAPQYAECNRIKRIAEDLIGRHHADLGPARIAYVMKERDRLAELKPLKEPRRGKQRKIARVRLVPEIYRLFADVDFIVEVDERLWDQLTLEQQEAVIDHELCHCARDDKGWYLRDHDVQEFREIVERHGLWQPRLEEFVAAAPAQQPLPFERRAAANE